MLRHLQKNKHRGAAENIVFKSSQRSLPSRNNYLLTIFSFISNLAVKPNNRFIAIKNRKDSANKQASSQHNPNKKIDTGKEKRPEMQNIFACINQKAASFTRLTHPEQQL